MSESAAGFILCPMCDEKKCVGRHNCPQIAAYIKKQEERKKKNEG